jgi:hypothetical protein
MNRTPFGFPRLLTAALLLGILLLPSLACTTVDSFFASPTPTATSTPTITPSPTPSPTPELRLSLDQRGKYLVILRYVGAPVQSRFLGILEYLAGQGFKTQIDQGPSKISNGDIILFGALSCNDALDDITILLQGKLDIHGLERVRFTPDDASYELKNIVIQIKSMELFGPGL